MPILAALLSLPSLASGQIDYDAIRSGTAGCPELAADPAVGDLAAFLCRPLDRTGLDLPINAGFLTEQVHAGAFSVSHRADLLAFSRGDIGESEFARLQGLLLAGLVPSTAAQTLALSLETEAAAPGTPPAIADALRAQAAAMRAGTFDESIPALLASRVDRNRFADLRSGLLQSLVPRDTVSAYADGVAVNLNGVATLAGLAIVSDPDGTVLVSSSSVLRNAYPLFVGPDGRANTPDDLPFVRTNPAAQAAGYALGSPIAGTTQDRFDRINFDGIAIYAETAQKLVDTHASPGTPKLIELYGVYNRPYLVSVACRSAGGVFDPGSETCSLPEATFERGCAMQAIAEAIRAYGIGLNADGDCIEVNSSTETSQVRLQVEVVPLLGDPVVRPVLASLEPVDLTDLLNRSSGASGVFARPPSPGGNVAFPSPAAGFSRKVDLVSGAPTSTTGTQCRVRVDAQAVAIGPNGVPGDGDDVFATAGDCLLWAPPGAGGAQQLRSPAAIAASHSANQSLFHTLCSVAFDSDTGHCALDALNDPRTFGINGEILGGSGFSGTVLDGVETIRTSPTTVSQRRNELFKRTHFLAINPLAVGSSSNQDLGSVATREQTALLGCGVPFASPCSLQQALLWRDPSTSASLGAPPRNGGIDLLNAAASVLFQEFATVKALQAGALVGATTDASSQIVYLPGMNFSRDGTLVTSQGPVGQITIEQGAYLGLTPAQVLGWSDAQRAAFQHGPPNKVQADGWVEPMPWAVDPDALADFGAVVFQADPNDPLAGPGNVFNTNGGEYCGRWMNRESENDVETPFNQTCTALETISANFERWTLSGEVVGQDRVFDPPESLDELIAMLDGDPSNDATGDPIAGPDGIFARNQFVFSDDEMDFEVVSAVDQVQLVTVELELAPADKQAALQFLLAYDPNLECTRAVCSLQVNAVLSDPDDAQSPAPLVLAMPIGVAVDLVELNEPNDPNQDVEIADTGLDVKVNLARLQHSDVASLRRIFVGEAVLVEGELVRMNPEQRSVLLGPRNLFSPRGLDLDADAVTDLDRDRDGVWDGLDDFSPGPVSDDEILCGSGIPGDILQDGIQFESWRRDQAPGTSAFEARLPAGLAPRSPVFCRNLNALLALTGPDASGSDAFLWHGGSATGTDDDADGWPDALDACPTVSDPSQADADADGVGDLCDSCVSVANARAAPDFLSANPWATLTGGQRDDDHDGFGNKCDGDFPGTSAGNVGPADTAQLKASLGKPRTGDTCGTLGTRPCALYDLDEGATPNIGPADTSRFKMLLGSPAGPRCPTCPLLCEAGSVGSCQ